MADYRKQFGRIVTDAEGAVGGVSVTVYQAGTTTKITLKDNKAGTEALANPFDTDAHGVWAFFTDIDALSGCDYEVNIVFAKSGLDFSTMNEMYENVTINGIDVGAVQLTDFDAGTLLYATLDNTPVATTPTEFMAVLSGQAGAEFDFNTQNVTGIKDLTADGATVLLDGSTSVRGVSAGFTSLEATDIRFGFSAAIYTKFAVADTTGNLAITHVGGNTDLVTWTAAGGFNWIGALTVGVDDTGHDVIFYGASTGAMFKFDQANDMAILRGPLVTPGILTLQTAETTVVDGNKLGRIDFQAPLDGAGGDAVIVGASIWAEADDTFAADNNSTDIVFATAVSGAVTETMRITHDGNLVPTANLDIGAFDFRARNLTADALTAARVVFTGAAGLLSEEAALAWTTASSRLDITKTAIAATQGDYGLKLINTTAAEDGAQQYSPPSIWQGYGWDDLASDSAPVAFRAFIRPIQNAGAVPTGAWDLQASIDGGAYATRMSVLSGGGINVGADADVSSQFGRVQIGFITGFSDFAAFSHVDHASTTNYAFIQGANGATFFNAAAGQKITFLIDGAAKGAWEASNLGVGIHTSILGRLHADQSSTSGAIPPLVLDQADLSEEMIKFVTTIAEGNPIEAVGAKALTTTHFIRVEIPGPAYVYFPVGTIAAP